MNNQKRPINYRFVFPNASQPDVDHADRFLFGRTTSPKLNEFTHKVGGSKRKGRRASNLYYAAFLTAWRKAGTV